MRHAVIVMLAKAQTKVEGLPVVCYQSLYVSKLQS